MAEFLINNRVLPGSVKLKISMAAPTYTVYVSKYASMSYYEKLSYYVYVIDANSVFILYFSIVFEI